MKNFWHQLPQPFVGLAPMDGVTDHPFRQMVCKHSSPDLVFTEFVNVEGLCHGVHKLLRPFIFDELQRPIVAQLYGKTPASFRQAALLVAYLGFDGVDINMGCPSKSVASGGSGAGLIQTPRLALEIIKAVKKGTQDWFKGKNLEDCQDFDSDFIDQAKQLRQIIGLEPVNELKQRAALPVSVKTRLGYEQPELDDWLKEILQAEPVALTIHGRTLKQAYRGQADWEVIGQLAEYAKQIKSTTLIVGNGDIESRKQAQQQANKHHLNGVLIGRAAQGNPFVFDQDSSTVTTKKLAPVALEHAQLFEQIFSQQEKYTFLPMRKHLAWYIKGIPQAKQIRQDLVRSNSSLEVKKILTDYQLLS